MRVNYSNWPAIQVLDPERCAEYIRNDEEHFFCAFNASLTGKQMKSVLISAAWNADDWTFDALTAHYKTLVRYITSFSQFDIRYTGEHRTFFKNSIVHVSFPL